VKITGKSQDLFIAKPDSDIVCILLYGPDRGLINERAKKLTSSIIDTPNDPFRVIEITGARLKADPAQLLNEAQSIAFGGGRKLIKLRDVGDAASNVIKEYLYSNGVGDALLIIEGAELGPRSSLRKLCESEKNAAAIACYTDDAASLVRIINETLAPHGLEPSNDAVAYLSGNLGSDRSVTRSELEKLALYMGRPGPLELDDAIASIGDCASMTLDDISLSTGSGDWALLDKTLFRAFGAGSNPVQILRAVSRHFLRLHLATGLITGGKTLDQALKSLKPAVMFMQMACFRSQLQRWKPANLNEALNILTKAEMDCKTTGMPVVSVCSRALMRVAQVARR
jgi:DNA polymerase-3 subunit delta